MRRQRPPALTRSHPLAPDLNPLLQAGPAGRSWTHPPFSLPAGSPVGSGVRASQLPGGVPRELGRRRRGVGLTGSAPIVLTADAGVKSPTAALPPSRREGGLPAYPLPLPPCSTGEPSGNDRQAGSGGAGVEPVDLMTGLSVDTVADPLGPRTAREASERAGQNPPNDYELDCNSEAGAGRCQRVLPGRQGRPGRGQLPRRGLAPRACTRCAAPRARLKAVICMLLWRKGMGMGSW